MVTMKKNGIVKKEEHTVANTSINKGSDKGVKKKKKKIKAETAVDNETDSSVDGENAVEEEHKKGTENKSLGSLMDTRSLNTAETNDSDGGSFQKKQNNKKKGDEDNGRPKKKKHSCKAEETEVSIIEPGEKGEAKMGRKKKGKMTVAQAEVEEKKVKIKKNIPIDAEPTGDIQEEIVGEIPKKKKMRLTSEDGEAEKEVVTIKKKKKKVAHENKEAAKTVGLIKKEKRVATKNGETEKEVVIIKKKKKKVAPENTEAEKKLGVTKKEKKRVAIENGEAEKEVVIIKKKKKKKVAPENRETEKRVAVKKEKRVAPENREEEEEVALKKKEKLAVAKATVTVEKDNKKRPKSNCTDLETGGTEDARDNKKAGKKEKRKASAPSEDEIEEEEKPKNKKKKKVHPKGEEQAEDGESEGTMSVANGKKAKIGLKKGSSEVKTEMQQSIPLRKGNERGEIRAKEKRKKIKVEHCDPEDQVTKPQKDVVFLSETKGNTDEINIDQARRLALQKEIDAESDPVQPKVASGLGQWGTAQFDSSDQQNKFLRLMGGFKKGGQPMGASGGMAGRANMALTKDGQQSLQQKLLGEFERAQSRRMDFTGRGAGLGFSAPSNKKFSIDINATRSVRFDD
ncbi:lysine-rich nucleolar protein 1 [Esox lucius]|uniref:lysine-rich nucleolar protein 1 n=1 Tax=Esox lucius TaxID=8010 RepID=UPI001476EF66|nr:lysine-rich nucleolar protein 1 [Esox lucius]